MTDENTGPPIDEALCQALVQGIAQAVLEVPGLFAPMSRVRKPVLAVGDEGPRADLADTVTQCIDVTGRIVAKTDLLGDPVGVDNIVLAQIGIDLGDDLAVL